MNIEKLKSGSYRITEMYKGKRYRLTLKEKPTKREAERLINEKIEQSEDFIAKDNLGMNFDKAAAAYIKLKKNVLSPSTLRSYNYLRNGFSEELKNKKISELTAIDVQKEINDYSANHKPKTTRNYHGFISAVLSVYRPKLILNTALPQNEKSDLRTPVDEEVAKIFEKSKGTEYEIALALAACGLRRSEIIAVKAENLEGNVLTISSATVLGIDNEWHEKTTKTVNSTRKIIIPEIIAEKIKEKGYAYKGHPNSITRMLHTWQDELEIPRFRLHDLRSYYASMMHALGVPDSYIMESGGWKSDYVMKKVYRKALEDKSETMQRVGIDHLKGLMG